MLGENLTKIPIELLQSYFFMIKIYTLKWATLDINKDCF